MILTDNIVYLKKYLPTLWYALQDLRDKEDESVVMSTAKNGMPTLTVNESGKQYALHSGYDPEYEAQSFISRINDSDIADYTHFFFYGVGLGYHIEEFIKRFPKKSITLYEPNPYIFMKYLSCRRLDKLPAKYLRNVYIVKSPQAAEEYSRDFLHRNMDRVAFITLPAYERIFESEFEKFKKYFVDAISLVGMNRGTILFHEKRWTLNSMINFPLNLENRNIFHCDKSNFKNKPVILAAAGPSLQDEYDNLRQIKKNGSAYIFAVGSAVKALANQGIYADAMVAMDPHETTQYTFTELVEQGITDVPLIYGTSIGFESLEIYKGPQLYMVMDKDRVTPYYLQELDKKPIQIVSDAPSVAVTTIQLLARLGFNPIILAGQNCGFRNNQVYAEGIKYASNELGDGVARDHMAPAVDLVGAFPIKDVLGEEMLTSRAYYIFKKSIESMVSVFPEIRFINTTRGGADLEGTKFETLDQLMSNELNSCVVNNQWYQYDKAITHYNMDYIRKKDTAMHRALVTFRKNLELSSSVLERLEEIYRFRRKKQINDQFMELDKYFGRLLKNDFYRSFISPLNMLETHIFGSTIHGIQTEIHDGEKGRKVVENFGRYIGECQRDLDHIAGALYERIHSRIDSILQNK